MNNTKESQTGYTLSHEDFSVLQARPVWIEEVGKDNGNEQIKVGWKPNKTLQMD